MKNKRRIIAVIFIVLMMLVPTCSVYGALYDFRDGAIEIELPDSWHVEEGAAAEDSVESEQILYADNQKDSGYLDLNVYYMAEESEEYIYFDDDETAALDYYQKYGKAALERLYAEFDDYKLLSLSEPMFYNGEWATYIQITATVENIDAGTTYEELIYQTAIDSMVHKMLIFSGYDQAMTAADMVKKAEPIVESFYDYSYDEKLLDNDTYDENYDGGGNSTTSDFFVGLISILVPLLAIVLSIIKFAKRKIGGRQTSERGRPAAQSAFSMKNRKPAGNRARDIFREKARGSHTPRNNQNPTVRKMTGTYGQRSSENAVEWQASRSDAGTKYIECLNTLHKSGLLTKEQLGQMIDKYEGRR